MKVTLTILSLAVAAAYPASPRGPSEIDLDGDGRYSLEELRRIYPTLTSRAYGEMDVNSDGLVTPSEFRAGQDAGLLPVAAEG